MTDKKAQRFTFDPDKDGAEMPTLTSLLYKKRVVKSDGSGNAGAGGKANAQDSEIHTLEPTVTIERPMELTPAYVNMKEKTGGITLQGVAPADTPALVQSSFLSPTQSEEAGSRADIAKLMKTVQAPMTRLPSLKPLTPDVYARDTSGKNFGAAGIQMISTKTKFTSALVFTPVDSEMYSVSAIVGTKRSIDRAGLWTGMSFSTKDFADLWGRLEKYGFAEFSTLGAAGQGNVDRMAFRTAFGAKSAEWITLVRGKNPNGGETLYAFISEGSIQAFIPAFHSSGMSTSKAA